jgi:hypothetical protein
VAKTYKIHPGIGIARVGNSASFFLQPEIPGTYAKPANGKYRDSDKKLKRQAARFWIFEYDDANSGAPQPISIGSDLVNVEWQVHLLNAKAAWFMFAGIVGEGPAGYPADHPLRNPTATDRRRLKIDPGPRTILAEGSERSHEISKGTSGNPTMENWPPPFTGGTAIESLGTLFVDSQGRLTVAGGYGTSGTPGPLPPGGGLRYDNNDNWFDDVSDGPVSAKLSFADGSVVDATSAWVVVAPPDYAPPVENIVTMYDLLYDLALRNFALNPAIFDPSSQTFQGAFLPSFSADVFPLLRRALDYRWVITEAMAHADGGRFDIAALAASPPPGQNPTNNPRFSIFRRLRDPDNLAAGGSRNMPRLHNDGTGGVPPESLRFSLTRYQYFVMKQWAAGNFIADWTGAPPPLPTTVTAAGLDCAALEAATGGSFFPGMEVGWIARDPRIYASPFDFRFRLGSEPNGVIPGSLTKRMAIPWQADFLKCGNNWWPAQRPNQVLGNANGEWDRGVQSHVHLVSVWSRLGVVAQDPADPDNYIESERTLPEPP